MSKETRRCFCVIRQKLDACFIMKHNDLVYRKGKKKQFDDLVENMVKLLKKARKLNTRAMGEMYEGPSLHPDCFGEADHQNQEAMFYCPKYLTNSHALNKKIEKEKKRLIYKV